MINIDLNKNQFDVAKLINDAQALGLDLAELEEYGFDVTGAKCGGCYIQPEFKNLKEL